MPLIDRAVIALHQTHLPYVDVGLAAFHGISMPGDLGDFYLEYLQENCPLLAAALSKAAAMDLSLALVETCKVIKLLNLSPPLFPFGRVLGYLQFVASDPAAREAQETLLDKLVADYFNPVVPMDANTEMLYKNRVEMIRERILSVDGND